MPKKTTDEPNILKKFDNLRDELGKLKGAVESWEGNKECNLHLLRSDQLITDEWTNFRRAFSFHKSHIQP